MSSAGGGPIPFRSSDDGPHLVLHARVVTGSGGGPDKTILATAAHLERTNYRQLAAYMRKPGEPGFDVLERRARLLRCPLVGVPDSGPFDLRAPRALLDLCRKLEVRIWHGHDYKSNLTGLVLRRLHPMKLVTTVHGWVQRTPRTPLYYALDRLCLRYYDHVIVVSPDLEDRVERAGVAGERCSLVPNAVEERTFCRRFPASESPARSAGGVPAGRLVVGAVGRLSREKGFHNLIRSMQVVRGSGLDMELWIAGDGQARSELEALIRALGLEGRVKLLGFVEDVVGLFHAMDAFVLSSVREGLPNALLEAMSMRVPAVATTVAGVPSVLRDGENGLLCRPDDPQALGSALVRLLADRSLRERFADAGRQTVEKQFTFSRRVDEEKTIYDRLIGHRP